jgi:DNA-binding NarL/FixJ family response regulator
VRVLLADDHTLLLEGLQNLLEAHGIDVVGAAKDGQEAAEAAWRLRPDIVLMDIRMPVCNGLTATRLIKSEMPETKIVMLTTSAEDEDVFEAVKAGASGYLLKSMDAESLIEALHDASQDIPPFAPGLAARLLVELGRSAQEAMSGAGASDGSRTAASGGGEAIGAAPTEEVNRAEPSPPGMGASRTPSSPEPLSARQREVLELVAQGLSYKEVGARVFLSPRTVKYHMAEIMRKLHLKNRAQVLAAAQDVIADGDATNPHQATRLRPPPSDSQNGLSGR